MFTLSSKEIMERKEKGQYFHCDEPFHPDKDCKSKIYKLLGEEVGDWEHIASSDEDDFWENVLQPEDYPGEISINALAGSKSTSTIRLQGLMKGIKVQIVIDGGSTHSFVYTNLV